MSAARYIMQVQEKTSLYRGGSEGSREMSGGLAKSVF